MSGFMGRLCMVCRGAKDVTESAHRLVVSRPLHCTGWHAAPHLVLTQAENLSLESQDRVARPLRHRTTRAQRLRFLCLVQWNTHTVHLGGHVQGALAQRACSWQLETTSDWFRNLK